VSDQVRVVVASGTVLDVMLESIAPLVRVESPNAKVAIVGFGGCGAAAGSNQESSTRTGAPLLRE
jgi:hypothetical protein